MKASRLQTGRYFYRGYIIHNGYGENNYWTIVGLINDTFVPYDADSTKRKAMDIIDYWLDDLGDGTYPTMTLEQAKEY